MDDEITNEDMRSTCICANPTSGHRRRLISLSYLKFPIDNIFKPMKAIASSVFKKVAKPMAKKAIESRVSHAGDKKGKKVAETSGDLIMKQLSKIRQGSTTKQQIMPIEPMRKQEESTNMILNRLISGSGKKENVKFLI